MDLAFSIPSLGASMNSLLGRNPPPQGPAKSGYMPILQCVNNLDDFVGDLSQAGHFAYFWACLVQCANFFYRKYYSYKTIIYN